MNKTVRKFIRFRLKKRQIYHYSTECNNGLLIMKFYKRKRPAKVRVKTKD